MIYIYDILLNFNLDLYEFYEWEKNDKIYHIKKIPMFKVNTKVIEDFINNYIEINNNFLNLIINKTEVFESKRIKTLKYSCLLTDSYKIIGILIKDNKVYLSDLLLDEAYDSINISKRCNLINLEYNIIETKNLNYFETRREKELRNNLDNEITDIYNEKDVNKLKYLYFEYFNKNSMDIDFIYKELIDSLNNINKKHIKLAELIKLCNKKTSNLTN